jgi:hypothetical protein
MYGRGCRTESFPHAYVLISETEGRKGQERNCEERGRHVGIGELSRAAYLQPDVFSSLIHSKHIIFPSHLYSALRFQITSQRIRQS